MKNVIFIAISLMALSFQCPATAQKRDLAIHTNILYDAFFIPNAGIDIDMGKGWTAGVNFHHAWWTDKLFFWKQTYGGDIHVDRHFASRKSDNPFDGHRIGLYGQLLTYDFEFCRDGQMAASPNYAIGLEYGYTIHLEKNIHLDFVLGVGYLWGKYKKYTPMWNQSPPEWHYVWQSTHRRSAFCPTKAEINVVWVIDRKGKQR